MNGSTLVSTQALSESLGRWRLFDCRHDLFKPELGEQQYREAHIFGARFAHLERDLSAPRTGENGRHPLPDRGAFIAWLGQQGLQASDQVVCYDAGNGSMAARLWWMLRWAGHASVAVLDGGFAKWRAEARPVTQDIPSFAPTRYPVRPALTSPAYVEDVQGARLLIDARAPARFRGEQEPIDPVAGHIPGAQNRFNAENITSNGVFKSPDVLRRELEGLLKSHKPEQAIHYCGSGVAACHNLLAMEIAGLPGGRLYAGSWSEWCADPKRPVAR